MSEAAEKKAGAGRTIDHVVLPVKNLGVARRRLEALGFTVAADARHPFGTANCCVYFGGGTFLEPLAVADAGRCEVEARKGNVFAARDRAYRFRNGEDGFSALVFATGDAAADHKAFRRAGISAGPKLAFSRPFQAASGEEDVASFLLAFAADLRAPDAFFFTCERVRIPEANRGRLEEHANGVTGIDSIVLSDEKPADFLNFLQTLTRQGQPEEEDGIRFVVPGGQVAVQSSDGMRRHFGIARASRDRGLRLEGLVLNVTSLAGTAARFDEGKIAYRMIDNRIVVGPAAGQGAFLAFGEQAA